MHHMYAAAEGSLRERERVRTNRLRESESVLAFLVEGQPDTDVIRDRWA